MRILLIKLNHIGDTLLLTPTLRWLRQGFPDAQLDVVVRRGCEAVLSGNPDIDHLWALARPEKGQRKPSERRAAWRLARRLLFSRRYDYAFDLSNSDRAKALVLLSKARVRAINDWHAELGGKRRLFNAFSHFAWGRAHQVLRDFRTVADVIDGEQVDQQQAGPLVFVPGEQASDWPRLFPQLDASKPFVVLHPASRWAFKEWHPQRWAAVADTLAADGLQVLLSAGPDARERDICAQIAATMQAGAVCTDGRLSLAQLGDALARASLYLGIDTSVMHLAAATQTPSVVLFGPSSEWSWRPWRAPHALVLGDCSCKQSRQFVCDKSLIMPCMDAISSEQVLAKAHALLHR